MSRHVVLARRSMSSAEAFKRPKVEKVECPFRLGFRVRVRVKVGIRVSCEV